MARCAEIKPNGEPCMIVVTDKQAHCWAHDPRNAEQCRRRASKGGRGKASREIKDLKKQLQDLVQDVLEGRVDRSDAVVVNQILNTRARLIELERRIREQEELEARIQALEEQGTDHRGGGFAGWG